jgi:hypothetical protein
MKLLIMQFAPTPSTFSLLGSNVILGTLFSDTLPCNSCSLNFIDRNFHNIGFIFHLNEFTMLYTLCSAFSDSLLSCVYNKYHFLAYKVHVILLLSSSFLVKIR